VECCKNASSLQEEHFMFTTTSWSIWRSRNASFWENVFARVVEVIYCGNVLLKKWREALQENGKF